MGFNLSNGVLYPEFERTNISFGFDVLSSSPPLNLLVKLIHPIIRTKVASIAQASIRTILPDVISKLLQSEIEIQGVGKLQTSFLRSPVISPHGMIFDLDILRT